MSIRRSGAAAVRRQTVALCIRALLIIFASASTAGVVHAQVPAEIVYSPAAGIEKALASALDGLSIYSVPTDGTVMVVRRDRDGEVEIHDHIGDVFIGKSGRADVVVGGVSEGSRQTAPSERRGGIIRGGRIFSLAPGDILWIPAGIPHQIRLSTDRFDYIAVKFDAKRHMSR